MYGRRVAVVVGALVLGFSLGAFVGDLAMEAENGALAGLGAGAGLGTILAAFVRE